MTEPHPLTAEQLRVLANPLRETLLGMLCREPLSATRIAERLPDPPRNLHYHLERLRAVGLIELVEERPIRGATEKVFRAVSRNFSVAADALAALTPGGDEPAVMPVIRRYAARTLDELSAAHAAEGRADPPLSSYQRLRLSPEVAADLRRRLLTWLEDCRAAESDPANSGEPDEEWTLFAAFFRRAEPLT